MGDKMHNKEAFEEISDEFDKIKTDYMELRKNMKSELIKRFKKDGYHCNNQGGQGNGKYGSNRLKKEYDLKNWIWIIVSGKLYKDVEYCISFQAFDINPRTRDRHVLMDRLGLYAYPKGEYAGYDCFKNMIETGIDLPMNEEKYAKLLNIMKCEGKRIDKEMKLNAW